MSTYRVFCMTENTYVTTGVLSSLPTVCPNDPGHTIIPNKTIQTTVVGEDNAILYSTNLTDSASKPYKDTTSSTYQICTQFRYRGSDLQDLSRLDVVVSRDSSGVGAIQVLDVTNATIVVPETTWSSGTRSVPSMLSITSFNNVPSSEAVLELSYRRVSGSGDVNIHSCIFR